MTAGKCLRLQEEAIATFGADKAGKCTTCPCDQGIEIRRGIEMAKKKGKKICVNCGRLMVIAQEGLCGGCWWRSRGLTGEWREEALKKAAADFGGVPEGQRAKQRKFYRGPRVKPEAPEIVKLVPLDGKPHDVVTAIDEELMGLADGAASKHPGLTFEPAAPGQEKYGTPEEIVETATVTIEAKANPGDRHFRLHGGHLWLPGEESCPAVVVAFPDGDERIYDGLVRLAKRYRRSPDQQLLWLLEKELLNERMLPDDKITAPGEKAGCDGLRMFIPKEPLPEFPAAFTGTDPKKVEQYGS